MWFSEIVGGVLMKKLLSLMLAVGIVSCASNISKAQIIGGNVNNGNMDETVQVVLDPNTGFSLPKPDVWIYEGSRSNEGPYLDGLSSEPWAGPAPTPVTTDGNAAPCLNGDCGVFFKPFAGSDDPNGPGLVSASLHQDHPATAGTVYKLSGWAGAEANALLGGAEIALDFLDPNGAVIGGDVRNLLPTLKVDNGESFNYKLYMVAEAAPVGTAEVRARVAMIDAMANPLGGGQAFVVDDFTLEVIPEPTTMWLAALGLASMLGLRRRT